jgi:hypothetical protein
MSEPERSFALLQKHRHNGVLLDTNLLLLLLVGSVDSRWIEECKATQAYDVCDFFALLALLARTTHLVVTAHLATEISNLSRQLTGANAPPLATAVKAFLSGAKERTPMLCEVVRSSGYEKLGVADGGITWFKRRVPVVISADMDLCIDLEQRLRPVINFSHVRGLL